MNYTAIITNDPSHKHGPIINFYDADYAGDPRFSEHGQFVAAYYISTLQESRERGEGGGLNLCGYVEKWRLTAEQMHAVYKQIDAYLNAQEAHK